MSNMILWGVHPSYGPAPLKLEPYSRAAMESRTRAGWTCRAYAPGAEPVGLMPKPPRPAKKCRRHDPVQSAFRWFTCTKCPAVRVRGERWTYPKEAKAERKRLFGCACHQGGHHTQDLD